ncbi:MAG TPA: hypothetical protein VIA62_15640 [Thermoanaerobaculia bacterium]|nr:hypothetical protein [Thermoanaerobaculia bacterium]
MRLPAGEEAGRQMADYMRAIVDGYRRAPKDDLRIGVALARLECQTA